LDFPHRLNSELCVLLSDIVYDRDTNAPLPTKQLHFFAYLESTDIAQMVKFVALKNNS
jgi:hypothetical protein